MQNIKILLWEGQLQYSTIWCTTIWSILSDMSQTDSVLKNKTVINYSSAKIVQDIGATFFYKVYLLFLRNFWWSYWYGWGNAEWGEGWVRGGEQVGCRREALDEGAGRRELSVFLCWTVSSLPALCRHVTPETLHLVAHTGVEPTCPRQTPFCDSRSWESSKGRDAEELWGWKQHHKDTCP